MDLLVYDSSGVRDRYCHELWSDEVELHVYDDSIYGLVVFVIGVYDGMSLQCSFDSIFANYHFGMNIIKMRCGVDLMIMFMDVYWDWLMIMLTRGLNICKLIMYSWLDESLSWGDIWNYDER